MVPIVPRDRWGARPPRSRKIIPIPTSELWLHHFATDAWHGNTGMRSCQTFHMDNRGWDDIAYSFVVDLDGTVFEGRGTAVAGAHTRGHNSVSHAIACMGNFQSRRPEQPMLDAVVDLVRHGADEGWWPRQITGGHRDVANTECPGDLLYLHIAELNRRLNEGPAVTILYYAEGRDVATAAGWVSASRVGAFTASAEEARRAARAGVSVVAVGGPASRTLDGLQVPHSTVAGDGGRETYVELGQTG